MPKTYTKKKMPIEAEQLLNDFASIKICIEFIEGKEIGKDTMTQNKFWEYCSSIKEKKGLELKTMESHDQYQLAKWGDYIIKGVRGEFYPCDESVFLETYEEVK